MRDTMEEIANQKTFKNYLIFWSGQLFSLLGSMVVHFVITWWIQEKTGSAWFLALASFLYLFHQPTVYTVIPLMVPKDKLSRINGLNFLFSGLVQLIGPALGATLSLFFTFDQILWIDIITFFIALIPLLLIQIPSVEVKVESDTISKEKRSFFKDFKEGASMIIKMPVLLTIIILAMFLNFLIQPLAVLLPYYINTIHGGGIEVYAIVSISMNAGMISGAVVTTIKKQWNRKILTTFVGIVIVFIGYAYLAFVPTGFFMMMIAGLFVMGINLPIINTIFQTIEQTSVPPDKIGRVMSIDQTLSMMIMPIGALLTGLLGEFLGVTNLFLYCGIFGIVITIGTYLFTNIRHFDKERNVESDIPKNDE
jgi:DHA3 family macrolide efflux protein-like MFS transporter